MVEVYARNINNHGIILNSDRFSLRCRQRAKTAEGFKTESLRFVSYKEAVKLCNKGRLFGPFDFYTISKL